MNVLDDQEKAMLRELFKATTALAERLDPEPPLPAEAVKLLNEVYGTLWTNAYYDPDNDATQTFSRPLAEKMRRLNDLLKFKP